MSLTAIMAGLRSLTFAFLTSGFSRLAVMFFLFKILSAARHPCYAADDENDGKD